MELLARKLKEAEALTTIAVYFLKVRPKDIEVAIKSAIHEVASINDETTSAEVSLKDWLCSFESNEGAIHALDAFADLNASDLAELEDDAPTSDGPAVVAALRRWMLAFVEKHGGRENVKSQILQCRPTVGMDLLRRIQNKSLLTWALRRLSELLKQ